MAAWLHGRMAASLLPDDLLFFGNSSSDFLPAPLLPDDACFCFACFSSLDFLLAMLLLAGWLAGAGWLGLVGWLARCELLLVQ